MAPAVPPLLFTNVNTEHVIEIIHLMDGPSVQLRLDLRRAIQDALATRRPLIHGLNARGSWLLQIPRPESAVRHGSRFYWNLLIDPDFHEERRSIWKTWLDVRAKKLKRVVGSIAEVDELLRENEILANGLRLGCGRKSNIVVEEDTGAVQSFIDAVVFSSGEAIDEETALSIHPDVPIFASADIVDTLASWVHFRTTTALSTFGAAGDRDWRSTSVPPLPDWIGIGMLPNTNGSTDTRPALAIAFNNRYNNHSNKLINMERATQGKRKRHTTIQPNEDEEVGEVVISASLGIEGNDMSSIVYGDPPTKILALVEGRPTVGGDHAERVLRPKYRVGIQREAEPESWIATWLRKPVSFAFGDMATNERRGETDRAAEGCGSVTTDYDEVPVDSLIAGESRLLH